MSLELENKVWPKRTDAQDGSRSWRDPRLLLCAVLKSKLWIGAYILAGVVGGLVVWIVGHRGVFFYDQSLIFDAGWRIVQGQVIYRDFFVPYGPIVFLIQALFFYLAGVDFSSMVLAAAVINALAIFLIIWI